MKQKRRKKLIELAIYSISFLIVILWLFQSTGCNPATDENKIQDITKKDTMESYKLLTEKEFDKTSSELSKLTGKSEKLNKEYVKLTEILVSQRNKIFNLIKSGAKDTAIVSEYTEFLNLSSRCKMKIDSLLKQ